MAKESFDINTILNDDVKAKQLKGFIEELVLHNRKKKSVGEDIKDIRDEAKRTLGIPTKNLNRLVREQMNEGSLNAEAEDLETAIELRNKLYGQGDD
jgi:uncharacterized protein (UPF0335 family)